MNNVKAELFIVFVFALAVTVSSNFVFLNKNGYIQIDGRYHSLTLNRIKLSFKTESNSIVLMRICGQSQTLSLEIEDGSLRLWIQQDKQTTADIRLGENLNCGDWHVIHFLKIATTYRIIIDELLSKTYLPLRRDFGLIWIKHICIGWACSCLASRVTNPVRRTILYGCIKDIEINGISVRLDKTLSHQNTRFDRCQENTSSVISFLTPYSGKNIFPPKINGVETFKFRTSFRTHISEGLILYGRTEENHLYLGINSSHVYVRVAEKQSYFQLVNNIQVVDGLWHDVEIKITPAKLYLRVDRSLMLPLHLKMPLLSHCIREFAVLSLGGGANNPLYLGFVGCLRSTTINDKRIKFQNNTQVGHFGLKHNACFMVNHCLSNPCKHGGKCYNRWNNFFCDCSNTNYYGRRCGKSLHKPSCLSYALLGLQTPSFCILDPDGSEGLPPFTTSCQFTSVDEPLTSFHHNLERRTEIKVSGVLSKSLVRKIKYRVLPDQITAIVKASQSCRQFMMFECQKISLASFKYSFSSKVKPMREEDFGTYWGAPKKRRTHCQCGIFSKCLEEKYCNCISKRRYLYTDYGFITNKSFLPITELTFIPEKAGRAYVRLGPLECFHKAQPGEKIEHLSKERLSKVCVSFEEAERIMTNKTFLESLFPTGRTVTNTFLPPLPRSDSPTHTSTQLTPRDVENDTCKTHEVRACLPRLHDGRPRITVMEKMMLFFAFSAAGVLLATICCSKKKQKENHLAKDPLCKAVKTEFCESNL